MDDKPNGDEQSPEKLLKTLQDLRDDRLLGDKHITISENTIWTTVVSQLLDHFIFEFPPPDSIPWNDLKHQIPFLDIALDILKRVACRVEGVFDEVLGPKALGRLANMCLILDDWSHSAAFLDSVEGEARYPSPSSLKETAQDAAITILRSLGSPIPKRDVPEGTGIKPLWKVLKGLLSNGIELVNELLDPSLSRSFPLVINLFKQPTIRELKPDETIEVNRSDLFTVLTLRDNSQLLIFLSIFMNVFVKSLQPPLLAEWFVHDMRHSIGETAHTFYNFLLHPNYPLEDLPRTQALISLVKSASLYGVVSNHPGLFLEFGIQLLHARLTEVEMRGSDELDDCLVSMMQSEAFRAPSVEEFSVTLSQLRCIHQDSELTVMDFKYIIMTLKSLDNNALKTVEKSIRSLPLGSYQEEIERHLQGHVSAAPMTLFSPEPAYKSTQWRSDIQTLASAIVTPEELSSMDHDFEISEGQYLIRILDDITIRFSRPDALWDKDVSGRKDLLTKLTALISAISSCPDTLTNFSAISCALSLTDALLESPEIITTEVKRGTYMFLGRMIRLSKLQPSIQENLEESLEGVFRIIVDGLKDKIRTVRLSAGFTLENVLESVQGLSDCPTTFKPRRICEHLRGIFVVLRPSFNETLLVTIGRHACRTRSEEILRETLCFLISYLGSPNILLSGTAYTQLTSVSRAHDRTPFAVFQPHMEAVAPYIITNALTRPELFVEFCRLISMHTTAFVRTAMAQITPAAFSSCDPKLLDFVARESGQKLSSIFLQHSAGILAHVFSLENGRTDTCLNFIISLLMKEMDSDEVIDVESLVKSCHVTLLARLVIHLGDENQDQCEKSKAALRKVQSALHPQNLTTLGEFLKHNMLGLISYLNEILQDNQGKKTVEEKRNILRSLGAFIVEIGPGVGNIAPQIMSTFQTMVVIPSLSDVTLTSWYQFLRTLGESEIHSHIGPTTAAFVTTWPSLTNHGREMVKNSLELIISKISPKAANDIVDLSSIPELRAINTRVELLRETFTPKEHLATLLSRCLNENLMMATHSLGELKALVVTKYPMLLSQLASGDMFDPVISTLIHVLLANASRDGEGSEPVRLMALECIGILGAVDPDRCELDVPEETQIVMQNFTDEAESGTFIIKLISDVLVGAYRSTSDMRYQGHLAYSIQELLRVGRFTPDLINGSAPTVKNRNMWNSLDTHIIQTIAPLLEGKFTLQLNTVPFLPHPIYHAFPTYREWLQYWVTHLISKASGPKATRIFQVLRSAVRNKDVAVAHYILPHLVLNILVSGASEDTDDIRTEIMTVLQDQVDPSSTSSSDKKLLSAQAIFGLLDHLNKWIRIMRQKIMDKKSENKRSREGNDMGEQLIRVDSILANINQDLMAHAALQCKAYARSLMSFERGIRDKPPGHDSLSSSYERLHEIYANLDEPDGMEGVSTLILSPSLEHQIRQHESTGQWTSAQSCWEVRLQESPENVEHHLGLLRCLRNLGHYDTLRTHVKGVLTHHPEWESALSGFHVESAWMVGAWDDVRHLVTETDAQNSQITMARIMLAMQANDLAEIEKATSTAYLFLGTPIAAAGINGYRRSYEDILNLHLINELGVIYNSSRGVDAIRSSPKESRRLSNILARRLDSTLPTHRIREAVLSLRRSAFALTGEPTPEMTKQIKLSWLNSAKIARKAGRWQSAYSALLQAKQGDVCPTFIESAKLVKASGEPLRAFQELEKAMRAKGYLDTVIDLTQEETNDIRLLRAKATVLRARWMNESERYEVTRIFKVFLEASDLQPDWESGHFHLGQYEDECYKALSASDKISRGMKMSLYTVRAFARAMRLGSKYIYQTVPRLLTVWLDSGEDDRVSSDPIFRKINETVAKAIKDTPVYKWFTAFPQIVSRVGHSNSDVYALLSSLIIRVMQEYPNQALWLFASVVKSTKSLRSKRGIEILDRLRTNGQNGVDKLVAESLAMTNDLLAICDFPLKDGSNHLSMKKDFKRLSKLKGSRLIIPLQESLTVNIPPTSAAESQHQPFPINLPTFTYFKDHIEIMQSLAKPRKVTILGSDGKYYKFLGKPKDDLRKDARLMDFNSIINKLLKSNSESRRRQLHIRTYGVVTLNEECGFIQWVDYTRPLRGAVVDLWTSRKIAPWSTELASAFTEIKRASYDFEAAAIFQQKVLVKFPPVFHEWFVETFPEPSAWLASRLSFARTAAVMSMVGFILGLGDRHGENILLDSNSGDAIHVDFNCLFEKGKSMETPERVPFRLTPNVVDGLGVTGVEGVFRIACEVTYQLLRDNKDSLMSVLDAFIHDPLVEWEEDKRKKDRAGARNQVKASADLKKLAKTSLNPIEKKLMGIYTPGLDRRNTTEKEISTSNMVQILIQEATDIANLARMYPGWMAYQ